LRSHVRRWAKLERGSAISGGKEQRFGVSRHFRTAAAFGSRVEVIFGDRAEAYLTPLAPDEIGVAILWSGGAAHGGFDALLNERFDGMLAERLASLPGVGGDRGAGPFRQRVKRRTRGAVALVGDAGGYVDALTGEGLSLGFEQALALGEALALGDLARYERDARRLARLPERLTRLALFAARHPALRRRYVAALARDSALFTALLGALGARRPLAAATVATLVGRLATARPARDERRAAPAAR
jgi:flavin-dependent dehydrogenase